MNNPSDLARLLRRLPIFGALGEDEALHLASRCQALRYSKGMRLFNEGELAASVLILVTGSVEITCATADGAEVVLATERPGALLGEMAVIDPAPRSASATALEDSVVLVVDAPTFFDLVAIGHPAASQILRGVASIVCARIRALDGTVDRLALAGTPSELRLESRAMRRALT